MRPLRQLAEDEGKRYSRGAVLFCDVYMDDVLTGAFTLDEARELRSQLIEFCTTGGFPLRKWSASDKALLEDISADHRLQKELRLAIKRGSFHVGVAMVSND